MFSCREAVFYVDDQGLRGTLCYLGMKSCKLLFVARYMLDHRLEEQMTVDVRVSNPNM